MLALTQKKSVSARSAWNEMRSKWNKMRSKWNKMRSAGAPKSPNNLTSTFFNIVHLLTKDLRFQHGDVKLGYCPGRYLTSDGAHPIKLIVTWLLLNRAIKGTPQKMIERYLWTFNWFLSQNSKLSCFNLLDLATFSCGNPGCVLIQPHTSMLAIRAPCRASSLNGCSGRLIITAHTMPYLFCPPSSCIYNSHIINNGSFLAYFMLILNSCVVYQVSNCQSWVCVMPAVYLLCSTTIRRGIRAAWYFCSCELRWRSTEFVLLPGF